MRRNRSFIVAAAWLIVVGGFAGLAVQAQEKPTETPPGTADEVAELARLIDHHLSRVWQTEGVTPSPRADDAEFLRRAYLDIGGKIPPVADLRAFLEDQSPDKRRRVVNELLESPNYITHFTTVWRKVMMPEAGADLQIRFLVPPFEAWLREKLSEGIAYDDLAREILTVPLNPQMRMNVYQSPNGDLSPVGFYQAKQIKPENLAAATSRIFLGVRIECAQCHDHPFDSWKQDQFWGYAAFFAGIQRDESGGLRGFLTELFNTRELKIPDTDRTVQATYLDGSAPKLEKRSGTRHVLADWMTADDNPYFAPAAVNRVWAHFFGRGLVDPVDDFGAGNPASHPELLDSLAEAFRAHNYDVKYLIRGIVASQGYQLTSRQTDASQESEHYFAKAIVKGLTPEQLFNSLAQATGVYQPFSTRSSFTFNQNTPASEIMETFADDSEDRTSQQTTILQALAMMNGKFTADATDLKNSETLAAVIDFPLMKTNDRIETLFLATLSRRPTEQESQRLTAYVDEGGPKQDSKAALADVFWALLNSSEFMFNR